MDSFDSGSREGFSGFLMRSDSDHRYMDGFVRRLAAVNVTSGSAD